MKVVHMLSALLVSISLTACGGGGPGATVVTPPVVTPVTYSISSYENTKNPGFVPTAFPYTEQVLGTSFFKYTDGTPGLVTATQVYNTVANTPANAPPGVVTMWKQVNGAWVADPIIDASIPACIHPRKIVPADFNKDGKLDFVIVCVGYDASPYPGERSQVLLSQSNGRYTLDYITSTGIEVAFNHGGSANDFDGDGYPDLVLANFDGLAVYLNDKTGHFVKSTEYAIRFPSIASVATVELVDVNNDGKFDLVYGGNEWGYGAATSIELNPGNNKFTGVATMVIPAVDGARVVVDFLYSKSTNSLFVLRTGGTAQGTSDFYKGVWLQQYSLATRTSTVAYSNPTFVDTRYTLYHNTQPWVWTWMVWIVENNGSIVSDWGNIKLF